MNRLSNGKVAWKKVVSNGMARHNVYVHYDYAIKEAAYNYKMFLVAAEAQLMADLVAIENQIRSMTPAQRQIKRGPIRGMMTAPAQIRRSLAFVRVQLSKL